MKDRKLAVRYARALLTSVPAADAEAVGGFLAALGDAMSSSAELGDSLKDPAVPRSRRLELLQSLVKHYGLPMEVNRFLETVVEHGRIGNLPEIGEVFQELREEATGIVPASITTARPLSQDMRERTRTALEGMTGKRIRLDCEVQPDLIGGAVTRIGSKVYDGTLRTQLSLLKRRMVEE
jgi:F-type H+-transporting ATPase subunit delta